MSAVRVIEGSEPRYGQVSVVIDGVCHDKVYGADDELVYVLADPAGSRVSVRFSIPDPRREATRRRDAERDVPGRS